MGGSSARNLIHLLTPNHFGDAFYVSGRPASTAPSQAKDILMAMLRVDPLERITIAGIRAHPWFDNNLPEYLFPLDTKSTATSTSVLHPLGPLPTYFSSAMPPPHAM